MTHTVSDLLARRTSTHADRLAFRFPCQPADPALTYAALHDRARRFATVLAAHCAPGDRALILLDTGSDFLTTLFGCFHSGVVAVAANATAGSREALARNVAIAIDCRPRCIVCDDEHAAMADAIVERAGLEAIARVDPAAALATAAFASPLRCDLAALQYTSGTTGLPKGVSLTHDNLLHNARAIGLAFDLDETSVGVGWLPLSHDMGLVGNVLVPLYWNFPVHLIPPSAMLRRPGLWLRAISESGATISGGPPFAYDMCVDRVTDRELDDVDLRSWRVAYVGGEPIPAETLDRFATRFGSRGFRASAFVPCYGLAESALFVAGRRDDEPPVVTSRVVVAHRLPPADAAIDVRIVDPRSGRALPDGVAGEICVRSDSVSTRYFAGTPTSTIDGLLKTGDSGVVRDGALHVLGRVADSIPTPDGLVFPHELERIVRHLHPSFADSAAFAVPAPGGAEVVIVQGVRGPDSAMLDEAALTAAARREIGACYAVTLRALVLVPARQIRRTTSGKVQRAAMREEYLCAVCA